MPTVDPALGLTWNGGCVRAIAQGIRTRRAFDGMPILADALQDAGCENEVILSSTARELGTHRQLLGAQAPDGTPEELISFRASVAPLPRMETHVPRPFTDFPNEAARACDALEWLVLIAHVGSCHSLEDVHRQLQELLDEIHYIVQGTEDYLPRLQHAPFRPAGQARPPAVPVLPPPR